MKTLVIGGSGFIGSYVLSALVGRHQAVGTFHTNRDIRESECPLRQLDVTDEEAVSETIASTRPDVVILVCGTQSIEGCAGIEGREDEPSRAWAVHVDGTKHVVDACTRERCRLAYVSTDCVFDGTKRFFAETDIPSPFNAYGMMKRQGEKLVQCFAPDHVIIRVSLTYGWRRHPRQFCNFALRILDILDKGESRVMAAPNLFNTSIEVTDAARAISSIALRRDQGVFHVASRERASRYQFARSVATVFGYNLGRIVAAEDVSGLRPPNSCLSAGRAESTLFLSFPGLRMGLLRMKYLRPQREASVNFDAGGSRLGHTT